MIKRVEIVISSNAKSVDRDIDGLLARLANLEKPRAIKITLDGAAAVKTELAVIKAMADGIGKKPFDLNFSINAASLAAQFVALRGAATVAGAASGASFGSAFGTAAGAAMAGASAKAAAAAAAGGAAGGGRGRGGAGAAAAGAAGGGFLGSMLDIFGLGPKGRRGIFGTIPLFGGVGAISGLHLMAQGILEITATLLPATIAMVAFGIAGSDAATTIYNHFVDLHTVMDATGGTIYPMTGAMEALHKAATPAVFQILGDAITVMNAKTGEFTKTALGAGSALDQLMARATVALKSSGMSQFLANAVQDLYKWGTVLGNLFGIVGNILKALPGYAGIILNVFVGLTHAIEVLTGTKLVQWLLSVGLGLHGFLVYAGLAATGIMMLLPLFSRLFGALAGSGAQATAASGGFAKFKAGLGDIAYNAPLVFDRLKNVGGAMSLIGRVLPIAGLAALGLAVVGIVEKLHSADNATAQWIQSLQTGLQHTPIMHLLPQIRSDIGAINNELSKGPSKQFIIPPAVSPGGPKFGGNPFSNFIQGATHDWDEFVAVLGIGRSKFGELTAAVQQFRQQGQQVQQYVIQPLSREFGGTARAMGLMSAAGITSAQALAASKAAAQGNFGPMLALQQQVIGTSNAMKAMGQQGGILGNDLQMLDAQTTDQYKAIQNLNAGWDTFTANMTATQNNFDNFALGMRTLHSSAAATTIGLGRTSTTVHGLGNAIDGLSKKDLALNQAFTTQVTNANSVADSWRQAGLSSNIFVGGVKAMIDQLLPFAKHSHEATAQLVGLAQEAGYNGPAAMSKLVSWLGNTHASLKMVKDAANQATIQEALLTTSMRAQGSYIANQLIGDINQEILKTKGVTAAAKAYGDAIAHSGAQSQAAHTARQNLINDIIAAGKASHDTTGQIAAMITKVTGIPHHEAIQIVEEGLGHFSIKSLYVPPGQGGRTATSLLNPGAAGMFVRGGTPGKDSVFATLMPGEVVVPTNMVHAGMVDHLRGKIPGFASGGMVPGFGPYLTGNLGVLSGQAAVNFNSQFISQFTSAMESSMTSAMRAAMSAAMSFAGVGPGPSGGSAGAAAAYARSLLGRYGWGSQWGGLNYVAMRESGWSMTARNPSSGAYGIAQFINGPSEYYQWGGNPNTIAGQVVAFFNYIRARYGTPDAAAAHERAFSWYHTGLRNAVFSKPTLIGVGDGGPEMVNISPLRSRAASYASGGWGGDTYNVTVTGDFMNPDQTAMRVVQALRQYKIHRGNRPLGIG